jgi:hypothetical protein
LGYQIKKEVDFMSRRFEEVIDVLDFGELTRFKNDLDNGAIVIKRLLEDKIKRRLRDHEKICATCSSELNFYKSNNYTLILGPDDSKKKMGFCGLDCLEYFIIKLKEIKSNPKEDNISKNDSYM